MDKELQLKLIALKAIIDAHAQKSMPESVAAEHDKLVLEIKALQVDLDRQKSSRSLLEGFKIVQDPTVPGDDQAAAEEKAAQAAEAKTAISGFVTLGAFVAWQKEAKKLGNMSKFDNGQVLLAELKGLNSPVVGMTREQLRQFKAIPVIGADVIEPTRVDQVRVTEHDRLRVEDVVNKARTTSDAVKYTRIVAFDRAADVVVEGQAKPQAALELDSRTVPVSTVAVWIPVQNQQMDDIPQLQNIIDTELLYDLSKRKEELMMYGTGVGEEFLGILNDPDVLFMRSVGADTYIDIIRRGITDVIVAGYEPNAIVVDPLDWEQIVLSKGSDLRYIVQVMVTDEGAHRLWGVPVIETVAMRDHTGALPEERNMVVGDFIRGATLWDRMDASIFAGWINDQFVKNQRTILAELRAAFAVRRPRAFRKYTTQVASAS